MNKRAGLEAALERIGTLGAGPAQSLRLLGALGRDDTSAGDVRHVMNLDPILATRVLRVANSAFYCRSREIGTLERAVAVLGFNTLRAIAAAASLDQTLTRAGVSRQDAAQLLRHSLFTAVAAQRLARRGDAAPEDDAFMAGLLHDIGCLAELVVAGEGAAAARKTHGARAASPFGVATEPQTDVEAGADAGHADMSRRLLERWQLPAWLCDCAGRHHDDGDDAAGPTAALRSIVRTADGIAVVAGWSHDADLRALMPATDVAPAGTPGVIAAPRLDPAAEAELLRVVIDEVEALTQALGGG